MKKGSINPLYQQWINTYSSDEFEAIVQSVLSVTNTIAASLTESHKAAMKHHFILTSKMEYLFWDMGYQQQSWLL